MALIDDIRNEVTDEVAAEMQAVVEERLKGKLAEKREALVNQKAQLLIEVERVDREIDEITPSEIIEAPVEEVTEEPVG